MSDRYLYRFFSDRFNFYSDFQLNRLLGDRTATSSITGSRNLRRGVVTICGGLLIFLLAAINILW